MKISKASYNEVISLAYKWQESIQCSREKEEKRFHEMMIKMLKNPMNKIFLIELLDQSFRANNTQRSANQLEYIFSKYENTDFFSFFEEFLIWLFRHLGIYLSSISIPIFISYLRNDVSALVIKAEDNFLQKHLQKRQTEGTRVNINVIGEIVLGEKEAAARQEKYIDILKNPNINYLSIKVSTLYSQIIIHAHEHNVLMLIKALEPIYAQAMKSTFINASSQNEFKFINLDMEEYKDIALTLDVFKSILTKKEFLPLYAGIVLQAYLPDTLSHLKNLVIWAKDRVEKGGSPIKVRIVKGANQEMELTEASLRNWPCVTYLDKAQTDANYKLLMDYLLDIEVAPYVHIGVASHNLFDQALAKTLARQRGLEKYYTAEMLEGMSEAAYKTLKEDDINVILYAPTSTKETFTNAIAYLVRRFDENTAEQNFLRHSFNLSVDTQAWRTLEKSFDDSLKLLDNLPLKSTRTQDRDHTPPKHQASEKYIFSNESDTDFSLPQNQLWADDIKDKWENIFKMDGFKAYSVVEGQELKHGLKIDVFDKSIFGKNSLVGSYTKAGKEDILKAIEVSKQGDWKELEFEQRQEILMRVADEFKKARADLIGIAAAEVGKVFTQTDVEVSEAIDFLNFYPFSLKKFLDLEGIRLESKGLGLVISPWNFPIAIAVGGIAASLCAGNSVILKPSSESALCAYRLCQCFWEAGVSKNTLQLLLISGDEANKYLIPSKKIDFVIFTGGEQTAYAIKQTRPDIHLSAETGGKNATIVTAMADKEQAIKHVIDSAFGNSGQKCSATSLLVLEKEVYEDKKFKQMLLDASQSINVGSVWDFKNSISTLSSLPSAKLSKALDFLDKNETWLLEPSFAQDNPYMLRPCIRWGTQRGDFSHMNELFGPVLSVMCAQNLEDAIDIVNETGYGLTSGLQSLDEREIKIWKNTIEAGNLYINRVTTGAIVNRQPFGGMKKSALGSGKKAGGLNYVSQFINIRSSGDNKQLSHPYLDKIQNLSNQSSDILEALHVASGFAYWIDKEFTIEHEYQELRGETNISLYLPRKSVLLRITKEDKLCEVLASIMAIKMVGSHLNICLEPDFKEIKEIHILMDKEDTLIQTDEKGFLQIALKYEVIRFLSKKAISSKLYHLLVKENVYLSCEPFVEHGRIELMHYYKEQSISHSYHRYGNLGIKALQKDF